MTNPLSFSIPFGEAMQYNSARLIHHAWKEIGRRPQGRRLYLGFSLCFRLYHLHEALRPRKPGVQAMSLEVEATYENGVLKLDKPLPLDEYERVTVVVKPHATGI